MGFELTARVSAVMEAKTFSEKFSVREFVVTTEGDKWPQEICFQCANEKMALIDSISVGDNVTVAFDIRSKNTNGRYFTNLNAWKITQAGAGGGGGAPPQYNAPPASSGAPPQSSGGFPLPNDSENPELDDPF